MTHNMCLHILFHIFVAFIHTMLFHGAKQSPLSRKWWLQALTWSRMSIKIWVFIRCLNIFLEKRGYTENPSLPQKVPICTYRLQDLGRVMLQVMLRERRECGICHTRKDQIWEGGRGPNGEGPWNTFIPIKLLKRGETAYGNLLSNLFQWPSLEWPLSIPTRV